MSKTKVRQLFADRETRTVYTPRGKLENSRCDPSYAPDSQIQNMLAKFARGEVHPRQPLFGDVSQFGDFREMQERVLNVRRQFDKLPSDIRNLCGNDPANLPDVLNDPKNKDLLDKVVFISEDEPDDRVAASGTGSGGVPPGKAPKEPKGEPKGDPKDA